MPSRPGQNPIVLLALGALALSAATPGAALPQQPSRGAVMLQDSVRQPVGGAVGVLIAGPALDLPALSAAGGYELFVGSDRVMWRAGPSRDTGMLMCDFAAAPRAASLLVTTDGGLGFLLPRLLPGEAQRITMNAVGTVQSARAGEEFTLHAAALVDSRRLVLPPMHASQIPLPAGHYEAWIETSRGFVWQRLDIVPGKTVTFAEGGPTLQLRRHADAVVSPAGRPDVVLLGADRAQCVLFGSALAAPLTSRLPSTGRVLAEQVVPGPPGQEPILWPPPAAATELATLDIELDFASEITAGTVHGFVLQRSASAAWRVHGSAVADAEGRLRLPNLRGGDDWLLVVATDRAPFAMPLSEVTVGKKLALPLGETLTVLCTMANGDPAIDVALDYVPAQAEAATIAVHTDRRGRADFGRVTLPGLLRASDARFQNSELAIETGPTAGVRFAIDNGHTVRGTAQFADGAPASGTTVTLRDVTGRLRPAERATIAATDGAFVFSGLGDEDYLLFATTRRDGRTWSSALLRARGGGDAATVTIRNEDPQPLGPGDRDR